MINFLFYNEFVCNEYAINTTHISEIYRHVVWKTNSGSFDTP